MKNRKLLLVVSLVLALTMSLGGTLAYLQDTDSAVNVMTLGNVDIEQIELQRGVDETGKKIAHNATAEEGDLVPFVPGQGLYPAFPAEEGAYTAAQNGSPLFKWGEYVGTKDERAKGGNGASNGLWNDEKLKGALDKFVFVKNTGSSPAYYRTWLAFECPDSLKYDRNYVNDTTKTDLFINANSNNRFKWAAMEPVVIEGVRYLVTCATYTDELAPGEISRPSLLQVVLTHYADNEDMEALGETYEILAFTQAVQTKNMEEIGAEAALNAAFGKIKEDDGTINHPWVDGVDELPVTVAKNAAELAEALEKGGNVMVTEDITVDETITIPEGVTAILNLGGKTITGSADAATITNNGTMTITGGTVKNTITNGKAVISNAGTMVLDDVEIVGAPIGETGYPSYAVTNAGNLTVEDGTSITSDRGAMFLNGTGTTTINGGTFTLNDTQSNLTAHVVAVASGSTHMLTVKGGTFKHLDAETSGGVVICNMSTGTVYVTGGSFNGGKYTTGQNNMSDYGFGGTFNVKGGTFDTKPAAKYIAAGYTANDNDDGTWTVTAAPVTE